MSNKTILIAPYVTEKTTAQMEAGHYTFKVAMDANKVEIRKAVEKQYPGVEIADVRTMIQRGKRKRQYTRQGVQAGRKPFFKKAVVTLKPGSTEIDFFEAV